MCFFWRRRETGLLDGKARVSKTQVHFKGGVVFGEREELEAALCVGEGEGIKNSLWLLSEYSPHAPLSGAGLGYVGHAAGCVPGTRTDEGAGKGTQTNQRASPPLLHFERRVSVRWMLKHRTATTTAPFARRPPGRRELSPLKR